MSYRISTKIGNLVLEPEATFIVNASNTLLTLGSGVSMAFANHCGAKLQEEMSDKLNSLNKKLVQGDVVQTSSGEATNFKYALHACVMNYNPGTQANQSMPTLDTIHMCLTNIEKHLKKYTQMNRHEIKLVLPLMGCGVGRLNKSDVVHIYKNFFERSVDFQCSVVIYAHNEKDYMTITDSLL